MARPTRRRARAAIEDISRGLALAGPSPSPEPAQAPSEDEAGPGPEPFALRESRSEYPKPTLEEVQQWCREDKDFWNDRDDRMRRHEKLYRNSEAKADHNGPDAKVFLADCRILIQKLSGLIARRDHRIEVPARGERNHERAQRIENALRWLRDYIALRWQESIQNPLPYDQAQTLLLRGWITSRVMLAPDDPTFVNEDIFDPIEVYPCKQGRRVKRVSHVYTTTLGEVLAEFPDARERYAEESEKRQVEVHAHYCNEWPYWHAVECDGEWVKEPTALEYWPWVIMVAKGSFSLHETQEQTAAEAAAEMGQGFLDCIEDTYRYLNELLTIGMNTLAKEENPPAVIFTAGGQVKTISLKTGARSILTNQEDFKVVNVGASEQRLQGLLAAFQDRMNKGGIPSAMFGEGSSLESGYMSALMMGAAQDSLWTYIKGLEAYHQLRYAKYLTLFRDFANKGIAFVSKSGNPGGPMGLGRRSWGDVLTIDDVEENGVYVDVVYEDITPQDRVALANVAKMLVDAKLISLETARGKFLNLDDPELENDKVLADLVNMNPDAVKVLSQLNLRRLGRVHELQALEETQADPNAVGRGGPGVGVDNPAAQGGMPPGGPPPGPGGPPPGGPTPPPQGPDPMAALMAMVQPQPGMGVGQGMPPGMPMGGPGPAMMGQPPPVNPAMLAQLLPLLQALLPLLQGGATTGPAPQGPGSFLGIINQGIAQMGNTPTGLAGTPQQPGLMAPAMGGLPGQMPGVGLANNVLPMVAQGGNANIDQLLAALQARGLRP